MTIEKIFSMVIFFLTIMLVWTIMSPCSLWCYPIMSYLEKRRELKKVLDVRLNLGYNELIKNEEWLLVLDGIYFLRGYYVKL